MSRSSDSENLSLNDEDINELFKGQVVKVPTALDNAILAASKSNAESKAARSISPAPWLAVAATVLMAIIVTPLMLTSPDSSLQIENAEPFEQADTPAPLTIQADEVPAIKSEARALKPSIVRKQSAPRALVSSESHEALILESDISEESVSYRDTPEEWINEINRLLSSDQMSQAQEEYDLFKAIHPAQIDQFNFAK